MILVAEMVERKGGRTGVRGLDAVFWGFWKEHEMERVCGYTGWPFLD